jgi:polysaccharide biosynthesis transport protein
MPDEFIEQEEKKQFDVERVYDIVRRRHMQFLIPLLLGWFLVWTASWVLPVRYKSTTTMLVEQPSVPKNYVTPNVSDDVQDRLATLQEQILSRTRLLLIANRLHLYENPERNYSPDDIVAKMRKDVDVLLVRDPESGAVTGFTVSYSAPSPQLAQTVTTELTGLFINENQATLQRESENTTEFLQKQLADARTSLAEQEAKVKEFQAAHEGELPSQETSNIQILNGLQQQLQTESDALNTARQQRIYYQSAIQQYETLRAPVPSTGASASAAPTSLSVIDEQLNKLKAQLADLRTRYTEQYPAVQDLEAQIATATKERSQLASELEAARTKAAAQHSEGSTAAATMDPTTSTALVQLQGQLQATEAEIANRTHDIAALQAQINAYQGRLNAEPGSEAQLADLTRGYEQSQLNYNDLLKKESESAMATSMEQLQEGERFSVLDPPSLPIMPAFPDRIKFCLGGLGFGLALGLIVAGGLEFLDDRMHGDKDIEKLLPSAIIGEIPEIRTPAEQRREKRNAVRSWAVAALVVLTLGLGSAINFLYAARPALKLHVGGWRHHSGSGQHV